MLVPIIWFIIGLILLIKGGDWFVDGSTGIAHKFHVPELLIGATVVSIGTTLPEVMVSATSAVSGHGEFAYGNAIGSIICNTALISALTIAIKPTKIEKQTLKVPVCFFFIAAIMYSIIAYATGSFTRIIGTLLLLIFVIYMVITIKQAIKSTQLTPNTEYKDSPQEELETTDKSSSTIKDIIIMILGAILIAFGADLLVDNGTLIAKGLGVPESVIALTFIALGTSLPELVTAITSLIKGHGALSLGNIIGANLFNIVLVSGVSIVLSPFAIPQNKLIHGMNASLIVDIPIMLLVMTILTIPPLVKGKLSRVQGIVLLLIYAGFCTFQFLG